MEPQQRREAAHQSADEAPGLSANDVVDALLQRDEARFKKDAKGRRDVSRRLARRPLVGVSKRRKGVAGAEKRTEAR